MVVIGSGCANGPARPVAGLNPFCRLDDPPAEMIPAPGAEAGWIDEFLAIYDVECAGD